MFCFRICEELYVCCGMFCWLLFVWAREQCSTIRMLISLFVIRLLFCMCRVSLRFMSICYICGAITCFLCSSRREIPRNHHTSARRHSDFLCHNNITFYRTFINIFWWVEWTLNIVYALHAVFVWICTYFLFILTQRVMYKLSLFL